MIVDQLFAQFYDDDVVSLCFLGILQLVKFGVESRRVVPDWMNANVKRWSPLYVVEPTNKDDVKTYSIFGYTWAFKGGPSSFQGHVNSSYFNMDTPSNFQTPMSSRPGSSDWQRQMPTQSATQYWQPGISSQPSSYYSFGQVPSHMGRLNFQTTIETHHDVDGIFDQNIPNQRKREQFPSKYKLTPFMEQPPTTILPKQRVNKTRNKGKKDNLSPLNLGGAFEDDNVEENNVTFLGYIVLVSFWQQLVPHFCMNDMHRLSYGTSIGWLSRKHMNSLIELLIRRRNAKANWTVAYTGVRILENVVMINLEFVCVGDRVRQLAMMNLAHEFNDASIAKDELGKAYKKCRDVSLEQRDLIENFLKAEAELDYQMNNALLLKAAKLEKKSEIKLLGYNKFS
nr:hypothetical protein [Tanacetum cinerariifolium]